MENSVFSIILRRKNRVFINDNDMLKSLSGAAGEKNKQIVATMNKNIEVFGYTMSEALFDKLVHMKAKSREVVYDILVNGLKEITGADKVYNPMYPNFPESVMKKMILNCISMLSFITGLLAPFCLMRRKRREHLFLTLQKLRYSRQVRLMT